MRSSEGKLKGVGFRWLSRFEIVYKFFFFTPNRHVVAVENIKAGELILAELPAVVGPYWESQISCVNCYKPSDTMCR